MFIFDLNFLLNFIPVSFEKIQSETHTKSTKNSLTKTKKKYSLVVIVIFLQKNISLGQLPQKKMFKIFCIGQPNLFLR